MSIFTRDSVRPLLKESGPASAAGRRASRPALQGLFSRRPQARPGQCADGGRPQQCSAGRERGLISAIIDGGSSVL